MDESLVNAVVSRLKDASTAEIAAAVEKAKADEISAFLQSHLRPVIDQTYTAMFGTHASKSVTNSQFGAFLQSSATLLAAKIVAEAIRESAHA